MKTYPEIASPYLLADPLGAWTTIPHDTTLDGMWIPRWSQLRLVGRRGMLLVYQVLECPF